MKTCPQCGRVYADDLMFCLQDGSVLGGDPTDTDAEEPTIVRRPQPTGNAPASIPRSGGWLKWAVPLVLLLFGAALAAVAAILFLRPLLIPSTAEQAATPNNSPSNQPRAADNRAPFPSPTATPTRTATPANREDRRDGNGSNQNDDDVDRTEDDFVDPGPSRITFRRGSVGETVGGRISEQRLFLLQTMAGQRLTARVSSTNGCVEFDGGGTSTAFSTPQGDSRVTIVNNCERPVRFNLSVTVR